MLWYIGGMFNVTKEVLGENGEFVRLVQLDSEDFAVIVRLPSDVRLHNRYIGPDLSIAEDVFEAEVAQLRDPNENPGRVGR